MTERQRRLLKVGGYPAVVVLYWLCYNLYDWITLLAHPTWFGLLLKLLLPVYLVCLIVWAVRGTLRLANGDDAERRRQQDAAANAETREWMMRNSTHSRATIRTVRRKTRRNVRRAQQRGEYPPYR